VEKFTMSKFVGIMVVGLLWASLAGAQVAATKPQVSSVKGYVFHSDKGEFGKDNVLAEGFAGLWNQVLVEAVLVIVEVKGDPYGSYWQKNEKKFKVQLTARDHKTSNQTRPIVTLGEDGKRYVSFLVPFDGCSALKLTVKVVGPGVNVPVHASIPASCGE
jgi:hypothetical protein